jgi:hypothetical protein
MTWRFRAILAGGYWLFTILIFFWVKYAGWDVTTDGALPIAGVTLPWSLLVMAMTSSAISTPARDLVQTLISPTGTFVLFPVICGGLNAATLYGLMTLIRQKRRRN